jgi:uncharacterized membrane protein
LGLTGLAQSFNAALLYLVVIFVTKILSAESTHRQHVFIVESGEWRVDICQYLSSILTQIIGYHLFDRFSSISLNRLSVHAQIETLTNGRF